MGRPIHFELHVDDPDRAVSFYTQAFGWKIEKWGPIDYWLITTGARSDPGIDGALTRREYPAATTVNTISVESFEGAATKIAKAGGKQITPKSTVPGVGYTAYFEDTEGNTFGIIEEDSSAS